MTLALAEANANDKVIDFESILSHALMHYRHESPIVEGIFFSD